MQVFGPIASRRFGQSLGVNVLPAKLCSYACTYCQVQTATRMALLRAEYAQPAQVVAAVRERIAACAAAGQRIDHISFVPDGEPTLDLNLGEELRLLRGCGIPTVVVTNGTLLWRSDVRRELQAADIVSVKVDTVEEATWRALNRPHPQLPLARVLQGVAAFAREHGGALWTETLLVAGVNDGEAELRATAQFLARLAPARAWLNPPTRPPFEAGVTVPDEGAQVRAYAIVREHVRNVQLLGSAGGGSFGAEGDALEDLLAILRVHPMAEAEVHGWLARSAGHQATLEQLVRAQALRWVRFRDTRYLTAAQQSG